MEFLNDPIELDNLPRARSLPTQPIEAAHAWLGLGIRWLLAAAMLTAAFVVSKIGLRADSDVSLPWIMVAVAAGLFLLGVTTWLHRRSIRYGLRAHDFLLAKGVLWRSETVQPLCRVQHVQIEQGPIEKRLDLASLALYSAGTGAASFQVPGLRKADAEQMRSVVLAYTEPDSA